MSEYEYYEFQAIDRPLTKEEQQAVARLSSRVAPHPWQAEFVYHWSDFPADPREVLARYYDAMLYIAYWGSRERAQLSDDWLREAIGALPDEERTSFLVQLAQGEAHLPVILNRRLREVVANPEAEGLPRRSAGSLRWAAQAMRKRAEERQARESAERRIRELEELSEHEAWTWKEVERLIQQKARSYDDAVQLLLKLRELAQYQGENPAFQARVSRLCEEYSRRPAWLERLRRAGLTES